MTRLASLALAALILITGCSTDTDPVAPSPIPTSAAPETTSAPVAPAPAAPADTVEEMERAAQRSADVAATVIGMAEQDATTALTASGIEVRIGERDGVPVPATADYRPDRVSLTIVDGRVTAAQPG